MITLTNLQAGYGSKTILNLAHYHIAPGAKCLITGPSGSGKTTLLYALAGLSDIQAGQAVINTTDLYALSAAERDHFRGANIGIVFQTLHLIKSLSVLDNVLLGAFLGHKPQDLLWAKMLLKKLDIAHLANSLVTNISQGQAQRVAIARALMNKPKLLLADEPTSSLDDVSANQVLALLQNLADDTGATLVVSSHDSRIKQAFNQQLMLGESA